MVALRGVGQGKRQTDLFDQEVMLRPTSSSVNLTQFEAHRRNFGMDANWKSSSLDSESRNPLSTGGLISLCLVGSSETLSLVGVYGRLKYNPAATTRADTLRSTLARAVEDVLPLLVAHRTTFESRATTILRGTPDRARIVHSFNKAASSSKFMRFSLENFHTASGSQVAESL